MFRYLYLLILVLFSLYIIQPSMAAQYIAPGVYLKEMNKITPGGITTLNTTTVGFVGTSPSGDLNDPVLITSWADYIAKFGRYTDDTSYLATAVQGFFANGGKRCYVVNVSTQGNASDEDYIRGLLFLGTIDEIAIVAIPGITSQNVQEAMLNHCKEMKDRFCILDSVKDASINDVITQKQNIRADGKYGALYYPWLKVTTEKLENGQVRSIDVDVPPSGYIAGVYVSTDTTRGIWKAPANVPLANVRGLKYQIKSTEQDNLNPLGINGIRSFSGKGILVWGARTLSDDQEWRYIPVMRYRINIEESVQKELGWAVNEPNNEALWMKIRNSVTEFLTADWRKGAFVGNTPNEAFFVKCDRTTMTQDDINNGRIIMVIGIAPIKPAEFTIFRIELK